MPKMHKSNMTETEAKVVERFDELCEDPDIILDVFVALSDEKIKQIGQGIYEENAEAIGKIVLEEITKGLKSIAIKTTQIG